jgi:excisionase family DNA binding protein
MELKNSLDDAIRTIVKEENNLLLSKIENVLTQTKNVNSDHKPLNFKETTEYLGCSKSYLYKLTSTNGIPHSKRGKHLFFDKKILHDWLLGNKVKTDSEIETEIGDHLYSKRNKSKN